MRIYGKTIIFVLIIFLGVGLFYYKNSQAVDNYPKFKIQTTSGDETLIKNIDLIGSLDSTNISKDLVVTSKGTKYYDDKISFKNVFLKPYDTEYEDDKIKEWIDKYRSFMRDKNQIVTNFIETDDQLIYGDVNQEYNPFTGINEEKKARVAVLDKKTKEVNTSFEIDFKDNHVDDEYVEVLEISLEGNQLKMIVDSKQYQEETESRYIKLYTFDLDKKKLIGEKELYSYKNKVNSSQTHINIISLNDELDSKEIMFSVSVYKEEENDKGEYKTIDIKNEYVIYNYETEKSETIKMKETSSYPESEKIHNGLLYSMHKKGKDMQINRVDLKAKSVLKPLIVKDLEIREDMDQPLFSIINGNYVVLNSIYTDGFLPSTNHELNVIDLETGVQIYEGNIASFDKTYAADEINISFHDISSRN